MRSRDANLDLLRAAAILAVVYYHFVAMWPIDAGSLGPLAGLGKYGVTLFFVLSGWLIGGIYWRELHAGQRVKLGTFWSRRWLRTVPPYLAALALASADVRYGGGAPLDYGYLFFLQNYRESMPYFLVSWSLCVEEHFYLILPLVGAICARIPASFAAAGVWSLPLLAPLLRWLDPHVDTGAGFGYSHTATHLVFEGLALGVAAAFTERYFPEQWTRLQNRAAHCVLPALLVFLSVAWWNEFAKFYIGQSAVAACCLVWLAACAGRKPLPLASSRIVYAIALSSYSIYLTHTLAMQLASRIALPGGSSVSQALALILWMAAIATAGTTFYLLVERPTIQFRDYFSRRTRRRGLALVTGRVSERRSAEKRRPCLSQSARLGQNSPLFTQSQSDGMQ